MVHFEFYRHKNRHNKEAIKLKQFVIILQVSGKKIIHYKEYQIALQHQIICLAPGNVIMIEKLEFQSNCYEALLVHFDVDDIKHLFKSVSNQNHLDNIFHMDIDSFCSHFINSIRFTEDLDVFNAAFQHLKLCELMSYLINRNPIIKQLFNSNELRFKSIVETNIISDLNLKEIAFLCHMSKSTLIRRIESSYGLSPQELRIKLRLNSLNQLIEQGFGLMEISEKLGYKNYSSFSKVIKSKTGHSPKTHLSKHHNELNT
jgi:AraC-like DNA-binding protein